MDQVVDYQNCYKPGFELSRDFFAVGTLEMSPLVDIVVVVLAGGGLSGFLACGD